MPPVVDLTRYLAQQYSRLGLPPPTYAIRRQTQNIHPEVANLPAPSALDQLFMQEAQREREGEESLGSTLLKPLSFIADMLSAGEYGVASSIRSIIKQSRGEQTTDPFTAFFRGVAAGFNSDEEYQTRMFDILTELGWNPDSTSGVIGKNVLGFALGVALDPISYIGLGPLNRALRIDSKVAQAVMEGKNIPARIAKKLGKGQWLSKRHGAKLYNKIASVRQVDEYIKTGNKLQAKAAAESKALQDITHAFMPDPGKTLKETIKDRTISIGGSEINLVDEAIEVITGKKGKQITDSLREWYVKDGWQKLLDPGGIKIGVPFTAWEKRLGKQFGVMGPRASGLFGLLAGNLISENMPLVDRAAQAAVKKTGIGKFFDKAVGTPFRKFRAAIDKHFRSTAGLSPDEKMTLSFVRGSCAAATDIVESTIESATHYLDVEDFADVRLTRGVFPTIKKGPLSRRVSVGESKMVGILALNSMNMGVDDAELPRFIAKYLKSSDGLRHVKEFKAPIGSDAIADYAKMVTRIRNLLKKIHFGLEKPYGIEGDLIAAYFPVRSKEEALELKLKYSGSVKGGQGKFPHQKPMTTFGNTYDDLEKLPLGIGKGKTKIKPDPDIYNVLIRRLVPSVQYALHADAIDQMVKLGIARHKILAALPEDLLDDSVVEAIKREAGTELSMTLAEAAKGARKGIPGTAVDDFFKTVKRAHTSEDIEKALDAFSIPRTLTDANVDDIMKRWIGVKEEVSRNIKAGAEHLEGKLSAMNDATVMFRSDLEARKLGSDFDQLLTQGEDVVERAMKVKEGADEVLKLAKERDVERELPALIEYVGGGDLDGGIQGISDITEGTIGRLKHLLGSKNVKEEIKQFLSPGKDLVKAGNALKGIKVSVPGNPSKLMDAGEIALPKPLLEEVARFTDFDKGIKDGGSIFLQAIDFVTQPLKRLLTGTMIPLPGGLGLPRPAFFGRNAMDLTFRRFVGLSSVAGRHNIKMYRHAVNIVMGLDGEIVLDGYKYTYKEVREFLKRTSLWHHSWGRVSGNTKNAIEKLFKEIETGSRVSYSKLRKTVENTLGKKGMAALNPDLIGSGMENVAIVEGLLSQMGQKVPISHALDNLVKTFFDYSKLTDTEKILSRIFLFYNFNRQAVPFALRVLNKHPFLYTSFARLKDFDMSKEEEANLPKWVKDFPFFKIGRKGNMLEVASMRSTFTIDVLGETFPKDLDTFFSKMNPVLLAPFEYALGRELFMKRDIKEDKYVRQEISDLAMNVFKPWTKARKLEDAEGNKYWKVDGNRWYLMRRLWFSRMFRDLDSLIKIHEGDTPFVRGLLDLGLGLKVRQYDLEKQQKFLQDDAMRAKSLYSKALKEGDKQRAIEILKDIQQ